MTTISDDEMLDVSEGIVGQSASTGGLGVLTMNEVETLKRQLAVEKERADYAWRNTRTVETARQEEMRKRDEAEAMYIAQCQCADEWAEKYRAEVERKADATLTARVAELEQALATMNSRLAQAQTPNAGVTGAELAKRPR